MGFHYYSDSVCIHIRQYVVFFLRLIGAPGVGACVPQPPFTAFRFLLFTASHAKFSQQWYCSCPCRHCRCRAISLPYILLWVKMEEAV